MSKVVDEPITLLQPQVQSGGGFVWRDREHRIRQVGGSWSRGGRWWRGEGYRTYIRITTLENLALDLCYDELGQYWTVAELMD